MSIPSNITKEHIDRALNEIEVSKIPAERLSVHYYLIHNSIKYPPKYVISIANKFANGIELLSKDFQAVEAKEFLKKLGYNITENKTVNITHDSDYYPQLEMFLNQAKTTNLKYGHYDAKYLGLKVRVSFGKGNIARIPWISFLGENQTTEEGVYPGYLYYKEFDELILSYCVSETNEAKLKWNIPLNTLKIKDYFKSQGKTAVRYGDSYIFKVYKVNSLPPAELLNKDLNEIILQYKQLFKNPPLLQSPKIQTIFNYNSFFEYTKEVNLFFEMKLIARFCASVLTKPFIILSGLSGSGKTKLAQAFVTWICANENQYKIVPVGADWTNREPLLGYPNALESGKYVMPDNGVLKLIIEAAKEENQNKPYFLILDEMNLSHVERYFADFLSAMESGEEIPLHAELVDWQDNVPAKIKLPSNLFIIGTVNIDETTYMFSPKVLDRANVIEFRVTEEEMEQFLDNIQKLDLESLKGLGAGMAESFVQLAKNRELKPVDTKELNDSLNLFFKELKKTGAEFGYRSASEIHRFAAVVNQLDPQVGMVDIIDWAIMQKLLPKVHGSKRKLDSVLKTLGNLCLQDGQKFEDYISPKAIIDFTDTTKIKFPVSLEKIIRMYNNLLSNGFTSYAEA